MKKSLLIILSLSFLLTACGRKGALTYEGKREQPNFDKVIDEEM